MNKPYLRVWTGQKYVEVTTVVFPRESKGGEWHGEPYNPSYRRGMRSFELPSLELIGKMIDLDHYTVEYHSSIKCKDRIIVSYKLFEGGEHVAHLHLTRTPNNCTRKVVLCGGLAGKRDHLTRAA